MLWEGNIMFLSGKFNSGIPAGRYRLWLDEIIQRPLTICEGIAELRAVHNTALENPRLLTVFLFHLVHKWQIKYFCSYDILFCNIVFQKGHHGSQIARSSTSGVIVPASNRSPRTAMQFPPVYRALKPQPNVSSGARNPNSTPQFTTPAQPSQPSQSSHPATPQPPAASKPASDATFHNTPPQPQHPAPNQPVPALR
jgi:hypothetical protein